MFGPGDPTAQGSSRPPLVRPAPEQRLDRVTAVDTAAVRLAAALADAGVCGATRSTRRRWSCRGSLDGAGTSSRQDRRRGRGRGRTPGALRRVGEEDSVDVLRGGRPARTRAPAGRRCGGAGWPSATAPSLAQALPEAVRRARFDAYPQIAARLARWSLANRLRRDIPMTAPSAAAADTGGASGRSLLARTWLCRARRAPAGGPLLLFDAGLDERPGRAAQLASGRALLLHLLRDPLTFRGARSLSRPPDEALVEAALARRQGVRELVLVSEARPSYGR